MDRVAPDAAAVIFEHVNRITRIARAFEAQGLGEEAVIAATQAAKLALKTVELTIGKQVNVHAVLKDQSTVPRWDLLPEDVRKGYEEILANQTMIEVRAEVVHDRSED